MTAYRCYLPVLTGLAGSHCAGPGTQRHFPPPIARRKHSLDREFGPAIADCGCRAPLPPRLARSLKDPGYVGPDLCGSGTVPGTNGGDDRIRTDDPLVANEVLSQLSYIPTLYHQRRPAFPQPGSLIQWRRERDSNPRRGCPLNGFRDRPVQPLRHLSAETIYNRRADINSGESYYRMFIRISLMEGLGGFRA